jgi:hypothetical protein
LGKPYVGQSICVGKRITTSHRPWLRSKLHTNKHLQNSWNKHGESNFSFYFLEEVCAAELTDREGCWVEKFKSNDRRFGYNKRDVSDSNLGMILKPLSDCCIKKWVEGYFNVHGKYPNQKSGEILGTNTTWVAVNQALSKGLRGLKGNRSLPKFIQSNFSKPSLTTTPDYTEDVIWSWANKHHKQTGKYPNCSRSGRVQFAEEDGYFPVTWSAVDRNFRLGRKGLNGGSSLSKFIKQRMEK